MIPFKSIVIIEAPGKVAALNSVLGRLGAASFTVFATKGHLFNNPVSLIPLEVDSNFTELRKDAVNPGILDRMKAAIRGASSVYVATDSDQEGDLIATDVLKVALECGKDRSLVSRVNMGALDEASIRDAFLAVSSVEPEAGWPATARRILDRVIGGTLSTEGWDYVAGRIQCAVLGMLDKEEIELGFCELMIPADDGKDPFVVRLPLNASNEAELTALVQAAENFHQRLPVTESRPVTPVEAPKPWNMADAIVEISTQTGIDASAILDSMQMLYEDGSLTYPRTGSRTMTMSGKAAIKRLADDHGARFIHSNVEGFVKTPQSSHECLRPVNINRVDMTSSLRTLPNGAAVLACIGRQSVAAGMSYSVDRPDKSGLPPELAGLDWKRDKQQGVRPWAAQKLGSRIHRYPMDVAIIKAMATHEIGRPSTWLSHATRLVERDLVSSVGKLTAKGRSWLEQTPGKLADYITGAGIERDLAEGDHPSRMVASALKRLGVYELVRPKLHEAEALTARHGM